MYCGYCGKQLESEHALICRDCGSRVGNDINYCTNCGGLRKNKKKKSCVFCGHIFYTTPSNNRRASFSNNKVSSKSGLIISVIFMIIWIGSAIKSFYGDLTATTGYYSSKTGEYVSVADRHASIPIDLFFVGVGIFFLIVFVRGFLKSRK